MRPPSKGPMHALLHSVPLTLQQATADPYFSERLLDTHGQVWVSLLRGSLLLFPGSCCTESFVCVLQESVFPVLCKFWRFYGGVSGGLLQKRLRNTQVCCTQSPCPCGRPLLTRTSTGHTQTLKVWSGSDLMLWPCLVHY